MKQVEEEKIFDNREAIKIFMVDPETLSTTEAICFFASLIKWIKLELKFIVNYSYGDYVEFIGHEFNIPTNWLWEKSENSLSQYFFCNQCGNPIKSTAGCQKRHCLNKHLPLFNVPVQKITFLDMKIKPKAINETPGGWKGPARKVDIEAIKHHLRKQDVLTKA